MLFYRKTEREFSLGVVVQKEDELKAPSTKVLGIDRGLKNLVVTSDNRFFNTKKMNAIRGRFAYNRAQLQAKGTRSAKRRLRKMAGRERRFVADMNHCISKQLAKSEASAFVLEDLRGIGIQRHMGMKLNRKLSTWPFHRFEQYLTYEAEEHGKEVVFIDASYTSQKCSKCGHTDDGSRNGSRFRCSKCGFELHADLNAARNIADAGKSCISRLSVNQPNAPPIEARTLKWDSGVAESRRKDLIVKRIASVAVIQKTKPQKATLVSNSVDSSWRYSTRQSGGRG